MARTGDPNARIELLRAAEAVFVERGLDRAKVEEITARAGRSKGSFYLHFDGKEDAFRQVVESTVVQLARYLDAMLDGERPTGDPEAFVDWCLDKDVALFEYLWQNRGVCRLVFEGGHAAGYAYLIDEFAARTRVRVEESIAWGVEQGYYRADLDVKLAGLVLSGTYDRVARELVTASPKPDLRARLRQVQELVLRGIGTPAACRALDRRVRNQPAARAPGRARPGRGDPATPAGRSSPGPNAAARAVKAPRRAPMKQTAGASSRRR